MLVNKEKIAEELLRLKAMKDIVESRMKELKSQIDAGEKIVTTKGIVQCVESERASYDEKGIYEACLVEGIDPNMLGEVVLKIDRKKVKQASGELIDPFKTTKNIQSVRIEPTDQVRNKVAKEME